MSVEDNAISCFGCFCKHLKFDRNNNKVDSKQNTFWLFLTVNSLPFEQAFWDGETYMLGIKHEGSGHFSEEKFLKSSKVYLLDKYRKQKKIEIYQ